MRAFRPFPAAMLALAMLLATSLALPAAVTIEKSPNDSREYAFVVLDNGLQAVLVSDPRADKAAASLDLNIGSASNPPDRDGLAHFLEHMLFLGTEKYPRGGEYQAYLTEHGGSQNAYTAFDHTNYYFDVDADFLQPSLDRFAQFFVAPLFTARYVERERQVVHSEYTARRDAEGRRIFAAVRGVLNPRHPLSRFTVGNNTTLADRPGEDIRERLIGFYRRHYRAAAMRLAVIGREPTAVLERWVRERFEGIAGGDGQPLVIDAPLYRPGELPARLDVVPLKDQRSVTLTFPLPPVAAHWRSKPTGLVAHLLGHEGEGSVLALLKRRGWADGLSAGLGFDHPSAATFQVRIKLTEKGLAHLDEVVGEVFRYLALIRAGGVTRAAFDEQQRLAQLRFRFRERGSAAGLVRNLADSLHRLPPAEVLRGQYLATEFRPDLVADYLRRLVPRNLLLTVVAPGLATDAQARWYDTRYRLRPLDPDLVARWNAPGHEPALALPAPNPFVPEHLEMVAPAGTEQRPQRIRERPGFTLWHGVDTSFGTPRASFFVSLRSPVANDTPRDAVLGSLLVDMVEEQLAEFTYPATLAGLGYRIYTHLRGLSIRIEGYADKQPVLLQRILAALRAPRFDAATFERLRADLVRRLANHRHDAPRGRASAAWRRALVPPGWSEAERIAAAGSVSLDQLRGFARRLLARVSVVALAHGNIDRDQALALGDAVEQALVEPARPVTVARPAVRVIGAGRSEQRTVDSTQSDSAVLGYFQGRDRDFDQRARAALLAQVLSAPFYEALRTERKLGYVVYATPMTLLEQPGVGFVVQSPTADAASLRREIAAFLTRARGRIEAIDTPALERHKQGLISQLLEQDHSLGQRSDRLWTEIDRQRYTFDTRERLVEAVRAIGVQDLRDSYRRWFLAPGRRELWSAALGTRERAAASP